MMLEVKNAVCGYRRRNHRKIVVKNLSMTLDHGQIMCVLGRNGAGKTTLFRTILGSLPLLGGEILLDGKRLADQTKRETALRIAYVPQSHVSPFPFTVRQIVEMGRASHMALCSTPSAEDRRKADEAMERMGIGFLADCSYMEISGGERQLALIARALAQEADYLIMDEPSSSLDFGNQVRVLELIRELSAEGRGILMTTHNPDQVFMADSLCTVLMDQEHSISGKAEELVTEELLRELYGIDAGVIRSVSPDGRTVRSVAAYGTDDRKKSLQAFRNHHPA